jgi:hypothetical protein
MPYKKDLVQNVWLTTTDPEDKLKIEKLKERFRRKGVVCFAQYFRDWSDEDQEPFIKNNIDEQGPREQHINNIISFMDPLVSSDSLYNLGINCFAGISRSTALSIIVWVMQGKSPMEALRATLEVRPEAWPNLRMLGFASNRLGVDIVSPVKEWKMELENIIFVP